MTTLSLQLGRVVTAAVALGAFVAGSSGVAAANHGPVPDVLMCGAVITANTTLTHSVGPCAGDGLVIGQNNITLNLNGYEIFGIPAPQPGGSGAGVLIEDRTGVTVTNGMIRGFDGGVEIVRGSGHTVSSLSIVDNVGSGVSTWGEGIGLWRSDDNTITNNTVARNGIYAGIGLYNEVVNGVLVGSSGNTVSGNTVQDNNAFQSTTNQNIGIRVEHASTGNTIDDNTVTGSGLDGIVLFATANDNVVTDNTVTGNGNHLLTHRKGDGIRVWSGATGNTISGNTATGNAAYDLFEGNSACTSNTWTGNTHTTENQACIS